MNLCKRVKEMKKKKPWSGKRSMVVMKKKKSYEMKELMEKYIVY